MDDLPRRLGPRPPHRDENDDLWSEALSALALIGAVALLVVVISFIAGM